MLPVLLVFAVACTPAPPQGPTVEEVLKKVREAVPKDPKYAADLEQTQTMQGITVRTTGRVFVGGEKLMRLEMESHASPAFPGMPPTSTQVVVQDGEFLWVDAPNPFSKEKVIFRTRLEGSEADGAAGKMAPTPLDPSKQIDELTARYRFAYKGEESAGEMKLWVLEGTPRSDAPKEEDAMAEALRSQIRSTIVKIGQEDGWVYHSELRAGPDAPPLMVRKYSNLRWNPALDPALFKFSPPADARIQDMAAPAPTSRPGGDR